MDYSRTNYWLVAIISGALASGAFVMVVLTLGAIGLGAWPVLVWTVPGAIGSGVAATRAIEE